MVFLLLAFRSKDCKALSKVNDLDVSVEFVQSLKGDGQRLQVTLLIVPLVPLGEKFKNP